MNGNGSPLTLHSPRQLSYPSPQPGKRAISLQGRAVALIIVTLVLLLATYSLWVLSVWSAVVNPTLIFGLWLLNSLTTVLSLLTGVAGVFAAATFVSYRAKVLCCGSSGFAREQ